MLALILAAPLAATAQQAGTVRRVGVLLPGPAPANPAGTPEALVQALATRGWNEGQNLALERRYAGWRLDRLRALAVELVQEKVETLVTVGPQATSAARQITASTPTVFVAVWGPAEQGFVKSLERPGGNVTGAASDLPPAQFANLPALLKEATPQVFRHGMLWDPVTMPALWARGRVLEQAYEDQHLHYFLRDVRSAYDLDRAFADFRKERIRAVVVMPSRANFTHLARIVELMAQHRLPAVYPSREYVQAGGVMAWVADLDDSYRQVADLVDKILKGGQPGALPVSQPARFHPLLNLATARALELALPQSLLDRAETIGP